MKLAVVFDPDPELGVDPNDDAKEERRQGLFIDSDTDDVLLVWRRYGDQFEEGVRTEIFPSGVFEHVGIDELADALETLLGQPGE